MLKLSTIVTRTDPVRRSNAKFVRLVQFKAGYTPRGTGYAACKSYSTHHYDVHGRVRVNPDRTRYVTVVEFIDKKLHVNVSCSCPDFMYRYEYALHKRKAADLEYSNGQPPDMTNPTQVVGQCKHLVALYLKLRNQIAGL